ncbi:MAG: copper amine oxidase [Thermoanaerobacteraceae bacterium]|nr:copper amine oxidase [Thermoanaerobacteraceae bacterium]
MRILKTTIWSVVFLLVWTDLAWAGPALPSALTDIRVLIEADDYRLAKYEPKEGTYLGAYVYQDTLINGDMQKFNQLTGKKHASFFLYAGYGHSFPQWWIDEVKAVGAAAHIAWEPNQGLDKVKDDRYLREYARKLKETGIPIFLRFASEMNGNWTAYSGDPQKYIEKWRLVHDVMEEEAPNVIMVWTVFTFPQATIQKFYPGDDYVDWVGVNIYNVVYHNNNINYPAWHEDPLELLDFVYDTYSPRKPIQISEFGATHYTITDGKYYEDFAINKISRMYNGIRTKYPRVKSIFYFDVNNVVNAPEGRRINNYALTDNEKILSTYAKLIKNHHFLSDVGANLEGQLDKELMNVSEGVYTIRGTTYVSSRVIKEYFSASLTWMPQTNSISVVKGNNAASFAVKPSRVVLAGLDAGPFILDGIAYLPLRAVAKSLGYLVTWDPEGKLVKVLRAEGETL